MVSLLLITLLISISQAQDKSAGAWSAFYIQQVTEIMAHSEGPHWVPEEQALYFVDIAGQGVHRYQPYTQQHTSIKLNDTISVIIPVQGRSTEFIVGYGKKISLLSWDGISDVYTIHHKFEVDRDKPGNRFNDGKADHQGRLWVGTMGEEKPIGVVKMNQGSLFRVSKTCTLDIVMSPVSISNGIAWNQGNMFMYYIDSPTRKIDILDYNECSGKITKRKTFFDFAKNNITGSPDGMTIDADGNLWIAVWGGGRVLQVSSKGRLLGSVWMPVQRVTSVAWGGHDFETLFVTTMRIGLNSSELVHQPAAGALFEVTGLPARGLPSYSVSSCYLSLPDID
ncbi:regucalcin [Halyomorpha halys]|uniref:regucalcin n=1 Tax=Halyomorpha halys TaxID=286706 RepID=UPI0006D52245|nr:regucalcin-like [Halyomorpha halys]XP_014272018.1 regucalcin-like [Halyomorpha halys]